MPRTVDPSSYTTVDPTKIVSGLAEPAKVCLVCGGPHYVAECSQVKEVEYDASGRLVRVVKR